MPRWHRLPFGFAQGPEPVEGQPCQPRSPGALYGCELRPYGQASRGTQSRQLRRVVRERIGACGAKGRLILGPTHVLEPEVPIANIEAYVQACRES